MRGTFRFDFCNF